MAFQSSQMFFDNPASNHFCRLNVKKINKANTYFLTDVVYLSPFNLFFVSFTYIFIFKMLIAIYSCPWQILTNAFGQKDVSE